MYCNRRQAWMCWEEPSALRNWFSRASCPGTLLVHVVWVRPVSLGQLCWHVRVASPARPSAKCAVFGRAQVSRLSACVGTNCNTMPVCTTGASPRLPCPAAGSLPWPHSVQSHQLAAEAGWCNASLGVPIFCLHATFVDGRLLPPRCLSGGVEGAPSRRSKRARAGLRERFARLGRHCSTYFFFPHARRPVL